MVMNELWIESTLGSPGVDPRAWLTQAVRIRGHELLIARPLDPDRLLDDPSVRQASRINDYMPYWAYLWPGAHLLAVHVLEWTWPAGTRMLEIGCGLGLVGLAALARGAHVTFSDYSPAALALSAYNAKLNNFTEFSSLIVDWRKPPRASYDVVLGGDVLYEPRCVSDVLDVLDALLAPAGVALLGDPNRSVADRFVDCAQTRGYDATISPAECVEGEKQIKGRIFRLTRRA